MLGDLCRDASDGRYDAETARYLLATTGEALPTRYLEPTDKAPALAQHTVMLREPALEGRSARSRTRSTRRATRPCPARLLREDATARCTGSRADRWRR